VITHRHASRMIGPVAPFVLVLGQLQVQLSQSDLVYDAQRLRFDLTPCHNFALLASITMRAIVMNSEMMDRTFAVASLSSHGLGQDHLRDVDRTRDRTAHTRWRLLISLQSTRASFTAAISAMTATVAGLIGSAITGGYSSLLWIGRQKEKPR
jgi:hypothetical protein